MRSLLLFLFFTICCFTHCAADNTSELAAGGNFSLVITEQNVPHTPIVEFFSRLERVARRFGNITDSAGSRKLLLVLDPAQKPGSCQFIHSREFRRWILNLPVDHMSLLDSPECGRVIVSALIQSRFGNMPQQALPEEALWIADGIWDEFVRREKSGKHIMRFTWLEALRNSVEQGFELKLDPDTLLPPRRIRKNSAGWLLYVQRARLMVETAVSLGSSRNNFLKDYCFLLFGGKLAARECFSQTFGTAARRKYNHSFPPGEILPKDETAAGLAALNRLAMKKLYSVYAPMSAAAWEIRLQEACTVTYNHPSGNVETNAALTDLPLLVEKYEDCAALPRLKIFALNEVAALAPLPLRTEVTQLTLLLGRIGSAPAAQLAREMKAVLNLLQQKINNFKYVENELKELEESVKPLLYDQRLVLDNQADKQLPRRTGSFIDVVENASKR